MSKKEVLHQEALISIANARANDKEKAKLMFIEERNEIDALRKKLNELTNSNNHKTYSND